MPIIGVEKLYYALITKDDDTGLAYDTPVYLPGVKEIGINPKFNTETLYAENKLWEQDTVLDKVDVSINIADLTNTGRAILAGHTIATEGGIYASDDDIPPYVAFLYKANKSKGEARYQVLYKGKFESPDDKIKGKEGKTDFQTPELKGTFQSTQNNGMWKYTVDTDDPNCPVDIDTTFFKNVIIPGADATVPTVTTEPIDGATGVLAGSNVVFTFNKAIQAVTVNAANIFLMKADGTLVDANLSISSDYKVVTLDPVTNLDVGSYVAVCTKNVKSATGIPLATNTIVNFTV